MIDIIGQGKKFLIAAGILVILSWASIFYFGLNPGIELKGGASWQVNFSSSAITEAGLKDFITKEIGDKNVVVKKNSQGDFIIQMPDGREEYYLKLKRDLPKKFGEMEEISFASIGPVIGQELKQKSIKAIIGVLLAISVFVAWAFRKVSKPISSFKYGAVTLITLFHDVSIPAGIFALLGYLQGVQVDINFIVALLFVLGFSVNDTIVVFDRIRENLTLNQGKKVSLGDIFNISVNETVARSINTSLTLILVLLAMIFVGPQNLFYFVLTILLGTVFGTYSSIFVASPLLYFWGRPKD